MAITINSNLSGPGFWKLNTSFLSEYNYVTKIKTTIQETKSEYANNPSVSPAFVWKMIRLKVQSIIKLFKTKEKRKSWPSGQNRKDHNHPWKNTGRPHLIKGQLREQLLDLLKNKKEQYKKIIEYQTEGAIWGRRADGTVKVRKMPNIP